MRSKVVRISEGSFISCRKENENFCDKEYLLIKNCSYRCCNFDINNTLIKFDTNRVISDNMLIKKAILQLPIGMYRKCTRNDFYTLDICVNQHDFNKCSVNWRNRPKLRIYKSIDIRKEDIESEAIFINITGLVLDWYEKRIPNNGITLRFRSRNVILSILNCNEKFSPSITLHYIEKPSEDNTPFIQLQSTDIKGRIIAHKEVVKFNEIEANDIYYDKRSGEVLIKKQGVYMAQWWISIGGSENISELSLGLENVDSKKVVCANAPVNLFSQVTGNALIYINKGEKLKLINMSEGGIQIDNVSIQASLIIFRV